jgi:D-alanine--poly(phosphoribitol) ligase subunit 2
MMVEAMEQHILDILVRLCGSDLPRLDPDIRLFELGLIDSLQTVELLIDFSEELGVEIAPSEVDRESWATPAGIVEFVCRRAVA